MSNNFDQSPVEFPFASGRRITPEEVAEAEVALREQFGIVVSRRGRNIKSELEEQTAISIRLHPRVLSWAQTEADRRGVGYQTVINDELLKLCVNSPIGLAE